MSKVSCLCRVSAAALPCVFLRLLKRSHSEGTAKALWENGNGIGHLPTVFKCKDSADLRHSKLFRAEKVTFPTFIKKRLSSVARDTESVVVGIVFKGQKADRVYQNRVCTTAFLLHNAAFII